MDRRTVEATRGFLHSSLSCLFISFSYVFISNDSQIALSKSTAKATGLFGTRLHGRPRSRGQRPALATCNDSVHPPWLFIFLHDLLAKFWLKSAKASWWLRCNFESPCFPFEAFCSSCFIACCLIWSQFNASHFGHSQDRTLGQK